MFHSSTDLCSEVRMIYQEMDHSIKRLQDATGLRCLAGCGTCCESPSVEATVIQVLPLAEEILLRQEDEKILCAIEEKEKVGDFVCILYGPGSPDSEKGKCTYYAYRPLVCRLFGFASRRNKFGNLEFSTCKILREKSPGPVRRADIALSEGLDIPVYQDSFYRLGAIHPDKGFRRLPINLALKAALESLYWKKPRRWRRAA